MKSICKYSFVHILILFFPCFIFSQPVAAHGLLKVNGNKIVDKDSKVVSFAGNSFFWTNWDQGFYNENLVAWLKNDWGTTIVRAAMGVEDADGYLTKPAANKAKVIALIDAAVSQGLYVIIDWHSHYAHLHLDEAVAFFKEMATSYGHLDNIIYEIYNEPKYIDPSPANNGKFATWNTHIKPYAEAVISEIRAIDPDNMIVVGCGEWSQKVDDVAANPITSGGNIAYSLHFYSVYHQQWLRDRATKAINSGIPLFATEWGPLGNTSNDPETDLWMAWCKTNKISHCAWAVNDKSNIVNGVEQEPWSVVKPGSNKTGNWPASALTIAGMYEKNVILNWSEPLSVKNIHSSSTKHKISRIGNTLFVNGLNKEVGFGLYYINGSKISEKIGKSLDISRLPAGIYILKVDGQSQKFVIH